MIDGAIKYLNFHNFDDDFLPRPWGAGTPQFRDDDAEAVERHLLKFGTTEEIFSSPRSFLQGKLEGQGIELHIRRKSDEGTWLQVQLIVNGETKMHICLDMLYPYQSKHGTTKVKDKEVDFKPKSTVTVFLEVKGRNI